MRKIAAQQTVHLMRPVRQRVWWFIILVSVVVVAAIVTCSNADTQPTIQIAVSPPEKTIRIGSGIQKIFLKVQSDQIAQPGLQFVWNLEGPGNFEGDEKSLKIFYIVPSQIDAESTQVNITAIVTDRDGKQAKANVAMTLLSSGGSSVVPVDGTPTPGLKTTKARLEEFSIEILKSLLQEHLAEYNKLKEQEQQGLNVGHDLITSIQGIIDDLKEIEKRYASLPEKDQKILQFIENIRMTRTKYAQELQVLSDRLENPTNY